MIPPGLVPVFVTPSLRLCDPFVTFCDLPSAPISTGYEPCAYLTLVVTIIIAPMLSTLDPSLFWPSLWDEIPHLHSTNWTDFSEVMEMLFYSQNADYLVGSDLSTTIPPDSILLDQQLFSFLLLKKIDDDLKPIIAKTSSALQAWLLLTQHFQGPFPSLPVLDIMDITPSPQDIPSMDIATPSVPDHSMAAIMLELVTLSSCCIT